MTACAPPCNRPDIPKISAVTEATFKEYDMGAKTGSGSKGTPNDTGKSGNDSGSRVKEARGPSYEHRQGETPSDKSEQHQGKHPPNTIYKGPKDLHPHPPADLDRGHRQSDKG
jgi:hypothetical protein